MLSAMAHRSLSNPEMARAVSVLRDDVFRFFFWVTSIGYFSWHMLTVLLSPPEAGARYWGLCVIVIAGFVVTRSLATSAPRLAVWWFLTFSVLAVTAALWLFASPFATLFYPVLALSAVILIEPLAGLVVAIGSVGLLALASRTEALAHVVGPEQLLQTGVSCLLVVACAWLLEHTMVVAVEWWLQSYEQARHNAEEARNHRAQLVQALKQLDIAYYRLERANASLELAWKAAETAERSKSEFVTNISHELRTPLNLIVGFSEMIVTSPESYGVPLPAAYRGDLNEVYRSAQHLLRLVDDVIDLARVGMGRIAILREPVELGQVIQEACDVVREYVAAKGLFLRVDVQPGLPVLSVDPLRIRQVLMNLLV